MPEYTVGDATAPDKTQPVVVAHIVNDIGRWGSGFVLAISKRWPKAELKYRQWATGRLSIPLRLGLVQIVNVESNIWVANMCAQHNVRKPGDMKSPPPVDYNALERTLTKVADYALAHGTSVHMPRIGCDKGGGSWDVVSAIVEKTLESRGVQVVVYDLTEQAAFEFASGTHKNSRPTEPTRRI